MPGDFWPEPILDVFNRSLSHFLKSGECDLKIMVLSLDELNLIIPCLASHFSVEWKSHPQSTISMESAVIERWPDYGYCTSPSAMCALVQSAWLAHDIRECLHCFWHNRMGARCWALSELPLAQLSPCHIPLLCKYSLIAAHKELAGESWTMRGMRNKFPPDLSTFKVVRFAPPLVW